MDKKKDNANRQCWGEWETFHLIVAATSYVDLEACLLSRDMGQVLLPHAGGGP